MTTATAKISELGHLVDGRIVRSEQVFPVDNPATGHLVAQCPEAAEQLLSAAADAAQRALPEWAARDVAERQAVIAAMAKAVEDNIEDILAIGELEKGAKNLEACVAPYFMNHVAATPLPVDVIEDTAERSVTIVRKPVGVVAAIAPWNAPILIVAEKIANALLVGNTVIAKPSPFTPLGTLFLGELWKDIVPPGVLNILAGGDQLGAALVSHPAVRMVSFTGSVAAGRHVAESCGKALKNVILELGGNDAAIVMPDVDPEAVAAQIYTAAFMMSGQTCAAIKRVYAHRAIFDDLVAALGRLAEASKPVDRVAGGTLEPLTTRPQFERVRTILQDARDHGAHVVTGGEVLDGDGYFISATILTDAKPGMMVVDEEQFGPVLPVIPFDDVEDAIAWANASDYGLSGSVWTADIDNGARLAARLECGTSSVNSHSEVAPHIPMGGVKNSGLGRAGGRPGLDAYAELQTQYIYKSPNRVKAN